MNITFAPRGILQIDDARIIYRNFSGAPSKFNREGDRNFALVIPDAVFSVDEEGNETTVVEMLSNEGWNVKIRPPRDEDDEPFMFLPIKVKFNDRGPIVYLKSGDNPLRRLEEDEVGILDHIDIMSVDLDVRPYDYDVNGKTGRSAYLQSIRVIQRVDRFAE